MGATEADFLSLFRIASGSKQGQLINCLAYCIFVLLTIPEFVKFEFLIKVRPTCYKTGIDKAEE